MSSTLRTKLYKWDKKQEDGTYQHIHVLIDCEFFNKRIICFGETFVDDTLSDKLYPIDLDNSTNAEGSTSFKHHQSNGLK